MKQRVFFPLFTLLAAAFVAGCSSAGSVGGELGSTGEVVSGEVVERTGTPTTAGVSSGAFSEVEATVGVSSTAGQTGVTQMEQVERPERATSSSAASSASPAGEDFAAPPGTQPSVPFVADPRVRGGEGYGADGLLGVRYGVHEGFERVVIDLSAGGRPAGSVPEWVLSSPDGDGLLRIAVPSASMTQVSGGMFGGPLLKNFHVVRAPEGGLFVDVFAAAAFTYRVVEMLGPARIVVDFKPSEATLDFPLPAEGERTVLVEPRRDTVVGGSLTISGYSRNPEASNTVVLTDDSGRELIRQTVMSNDWTATWGYFETTLDLPRFRGRATLEVGAESARDGTFEGVKIPVSGTG